MFSKVGATEALPLITVGLKEKGASGNTFATVETSSVNFLIYPEIPPNAPPSIALPPAANAMARRASSES